MTDAELDKLITSDKREKLKLLKEDTTESNDIAMKRMTPQVPSKDKGKTLCMGKAI